MAYLLLGTCDRKDNWHVEAPRSKRRCFSFLRCRLSLFIETTVKLRKTLTKATTKKRTTTNYTCTRFYSGGFFPIHVTFFGINCVFLPAGAVSTSLSQSQDARTRGISPRSRRTSPDERRSLIWFDDWMEAKAEGRVPSEDDKRRKDKRA